MYLAAVFWKNPFAGVFGKNTVRISLLMLFVSTAWADFDRLCCWAGMPDGTVHVDVIAMRFGFMHKFCACCVQSESGKVFKCRSLVSCPGGPPGTCAGGLIGTPCSQCAAGLKILLCHPACSGMGLPFLVLRCLHEHIFHDGLQSPNPASMQRKPTSVCLRHPRFRFAWGV